MQLSFCPILYACLGVVDSILFIKFICTLCIFSSKIESLFCLDECFGDFIGVPFCGTSVKRCEFFSLLILVGGFRCVLKLLIVRT